MWSWSDFKSQPPAAPDLQSCCLFDVTAADPHIAEEDEDEWVSYSLCLHQILCCCVEFRWGRKDENKAAGTEMKIKPVGPLNLFTAEAEPVLVGRFWWSDLLKVGITEALKNFPPFYQTDLFCRKPLKLSAEEGKSWFSSSQLWWRGRCF